jgi:CRP-like cAMP-binding protein
MHFHPEEYIIRQGQKATHMYILAHGSCEVLVRDQFKKESFVKGLSPGTIFGEVALLHNTRRTASIRCKD